MRVRNEWGITWDGLFLFRFKAQSINMVWESGWSFRIEYKKKIVLHHVFGATINEFCSCPEELEKFKETFDCPSEFNELEKSIKKFGKIDLDVLRNEGKYHEFISKGKFLSIKTNNNSDYSIDALCYQRSKTVQKSFGSYGWFFNFYRFDFAWVTSTNEAS